MPIMCLLTIFSLWLRAFDFDFFLQQQQQQAVSHCSRKFFLSLNWGVQSGKEKLYDLRFLSKKKCVWSDETILLYTFSVFLPYIHSLTLHTHYHNNSSCYVESTSVLPLAARSRSSFWKRMPSRARLSEMRFPNFRSLFPPCAVVLSYLIFLTFSFFR